MNDDEFFTATTELKIIRQWARARYAAPWAVFGGVMLRVDATTGPDVQLPGVIGGPASLNLLAAFVSPSGGGKGISDKVARLAWPVDIVERPIGSGEGLAATFTPKGDVEPVTRAIVNVPEIDTLAGLASRQGSILLAQLKSVAMGEQIGQANASAATTRIVPAHSYRLCMSVGAQPGHTGVLFDDTTGGTPQRFLWFMTTDPHMPAESTPDPDPLDITLPFWKSNEHDIVEIGYGPPEIRETIIAAHIARQRGQADALDGHAMLTRCKVAAVLAIMHKRSVVSELDWQLSDVVMTESNRVREWIVTEAKRAERQKNRDRALARSDFENTIGNRQVERAAKGILSRLDRRSEDAPMLASEIRRGLRSDLRKEFDAALQHLQQAGQISIVKQSGVVHVDTPSTSDNRRSEPQDDVDTTVHVDNLKGLEPVHVDNPVHVHNRRSNDVDTTVHVDNLKQTGEEQRVPSDEGPTRCRVCSIELPKVATGGMCEECADPAHQILERPPARNLTVIHSGNRPDAGSTRVRCAHCNEPLIYDDDQRDGYHTSKSKCVRAHKAGA